MNNEKIQTSKLDIILEKKQGLDAIIQDYETRIDEKLASLAENEILSKKTNPELFEISIHEPNPSDDHFLSGVDMSDDDALDQAVLNSNPVSDGDNQLAFNEDKFTDDKNAPVFNTDQKPLHAIETPEVLRSSPITITPLHSDNITSNKPPEHSDLLAEISVPGKDQLPKDPPLEPTPEKTKKAIAEAVPSPKVSQPVYSKKKPLKSVKPQTSTAKLNLVDMVLPSVFFIAGLLTFGVFLILFSQDFSFVDYSVLFILFTCLIFTIAMPYSASLFFMALLFCSYVALTLISIFYLEVPLELYQVGWVIVIPLILWSSALLIRKVRELFKAKKSLESQIASYNELDEGPGLTIEKAYYKDLKCAMDRATKGETILVLDMMSISHLETLKSITGPRLWDEILYKTLNIIKQHCFSTHLIYVLEGNVFSIIMENTSMKNQLMINQGINEAFNAMILEYNAIDVPVELNIITVPYSREITNPFEYRALGLHQLEN